MKKYLTAMILLGLFVAIPVLAQTTGGQNPNQSLWKTIMALTRQLGGLQQTAAVVSSTNTNVTPAPGPTPGPTTTTGCGQTLTPSGTANQTIRCDGTNWVAAGNLLNDGVNIAIGPSTLSNQDARLYVNDRNGGEVYQTMIATKNSSAFGSGVRASAIARGSIGILGIAEGVDTAGIKGVTEAEISSTTVAVLGEASTGGGIAVKAVTGNNPNLGFYQTGPYAINSFQGKLGLGVAIPQERLEISGGMRFVYAGSNPPCHNDRRGTLWFVQSNFGSMDKLLVCAKTATSTYVWRDLF